MHFSVWVSSSLENRSTFDVYVRTVFIFQFPSSIQSRRPSLSRQLHSSLLQTWPKQCYGPIGIGSIAPHSVDLIETRAQCSWDSLVPMVLHEDYAFTNQAHCNFRSSDHGDLAAAPTSPPLAVLPSLAQSHPACLRGHSLTIVVDGFCVA